MMDVIVISHFKLFFPLLPLQHPKNQNFEKMKKTPGDIILLHTCTKNYDQMVYDSWDMVHDGHNCYFWFWAIFCPFNPLTAQNLKILKKWKCLDKLSFYILHKCTKNFDQVMYSSWEYDAQWTDKRTDSRTDGQKKWHTEVSAPPNNKLQKGVITWYIIF